MRTRAGHPLKFTKGTDPLKKELLEFMVDDSCAATPYYLPMDESDAIVTSNVIQALILNDEIPVLEYVKREHYYNCF
jgi:hypothetical protein